MAVSPEPRDPRGRRVTGTHKTLSQKGSPALQMQIEELAQFLPATRALPVLGSSGARAAEPPISDFKLEPHRDGVAQTLSMAHSGHLRPAGQAVGALRSRTSTGYTSFRMLLKHDYAAGPTMTRRQGTVRGPLGLQAIGDKTLLIRHRHTACLVPVAAGADDQVYNEEVEKLRDRTAAYSTATCHTKEC